MPDNTSFDANLKRAIEQLQEEEIEQLQQAAEQEPHVFSEPFHRKMKKMIALSNKPYFSFVNTAAKRVAILAVVTVTVMAVTTLSVDALRKPVIEFFTTIHKTYTDITFKTEEDTASLPETIETEHLPTYLPEGYVVSDRQDLIGIVQITYAHKTEYEINFEQKTIDETNMTVDTEGTALENILVCGYEGKYLSNKGFQHLIWTDGSYHYYLLGPVSKEELLLMAESVE